MKRSRLFSTAVAAFLAAALFSQSALAGSPLICHPYDIGDAKSLPWVEFESRTGLHPYELARLVDDTLSLLTPETPVIVRMETMRRATVYTVWAKKKDANSQIADQLLARLIERAKDQGPSNAQALFDLGYLVASFKMGRITVTNPKFQEMDGYPMIVKASSLRDGDPDMEFAAALASHKWSKVQSDEHQQRLRNAVAGAKDGSLLARNLVKHFGRPGQSLSDLRTSGL
jgi:hypothetical protein